MTFQNTVLGSSIRLTIRLFRIFLDIWIQIQKITGRDSEIPISELSSNVGRFTKTAFPEGPQKVQKTSSAD